MKTNENKSPKSAAGWNAWRRIFGRGPLPDEVAPEDEAATPLVSPLARLQEYLHSHGLGQQVNARYETAGGGFVLEDVDGLVHAKDYGAAVAIIERIWLYRP